MICCFLTGVQCRIEDAYVLNRREASELHSLLKDRVASLRRVVEQFSPLDDQDATMAVPAARRRGVASKKHRLVCKAVADALSPAFPEIKLFLSWPQYQAHVRQVSMQGLRSHPQFGNAVETLSDAELRQGERLGRRVLDLLDKQRVLPPNTRLAIMVSTSVRHRDRSPEEVTKLIRVAATAHGSPEPLGITATDLEAVRSLLAVRENTKPLEQAAKKALPGHEAKPQP